MLGNFHPCSSDHERANSRNIKGAGSVAARAARVDDRFAADSRLDSTDFARIARAKPTSSSGVSPFIRSATRNAAIWACCSGPGEYQLHHELGFGGAKVLAVHRFVKVGDERHAILNAWLPCQTSTRSFRPWLPEQKDSQKLRSNPMKIHEYQAKALLAKYGVPVPRGEVAETVEQAVDAARKLGGRVVVKAQIHAGGRGKGGGVKLATGPDETSASGRARFSA